MPRGRQRRDRRPHRVALGASARRLRLCAGHDVLDDMLQHVLACLAARKVLGWPKRCKLAHEFLWECSCERLMLAQLLGQLGVFLTYRAGSPVRGCR